MEPCAFPASNPNPLLLFMSLLEVKEVRKSFGKRLILDDLSFSCETGEIIGIFGRNGCGKSTLLKSVMGAFKADAIQVQIDQQTLNPSVVISSRKIGYLPQGPFLPSEMKVRDVIPLVFKKGEEQDRIFYAEGVAAFDNKQVGKLSSGQRKYLELLLLAHLKHPFLLLDEPFSLVEPHYIEKIKILLLSLKGHKGIVITDHYYRDVLEIATRSFLIRSGKKHPIKNERDLVEFDYLKATEK